MSQLIYLREEIDRGKTGKLIMAYPVVTITIRIKNIEHEGVPCYAWQLAVTGLRPYPEQPPIHTVLHPTWETLLDGIDGSQTRSVDWILCRDSLLDYLPPERKLIL